MTNIQKIKSWLELNETHREYEKWLNKYQELVDKLRTVGIAEDEALNFVKPSLTDVFAGILEPIQGGDIK